MNRLKYSLLFAMMAAAVGYLALEVGSVPGTVVLGNVSAAFLLVALAYAPNRPGVFMKRSDGRWSPGAYVFLWPYLLLAFATSHLRRLLSKERAFDHIDGNVFLGRRLTSREAHRCELTFTNVLDLTCEFPECRAMREAEAYLLLPTLDTLAPTPEQIRTAVVWLDEHAARGPTCVHCAAGHGRSATVVIAWMLNRDPELGLKGAIRQIKEKRPAIGLTPEQLTALSVS